MSAPLDDWRAGGFGVYVHWPFCLAKCPYCDFNSHVWREVDQERWRTSLLAEIDAAAAEIPGRTVDTVFFGGGTPSLMPPETVAAIIERIGQCWDLAKDAEITLEANPTSVEAGRFRGYRDAGVNRVSMGVQALNDADLKALGRMHSAAEARAALDVARGVFDRVSFDLIYARQNQSAEAWRAELKEALGMAIDHLSLYQLTIETGTRFGELHARGGLRGLPSDDIAADMYLATQEICDAAGMPAYEISNHARRRSNSGAESRHNLIYWRYGDYVGVGPGAHGRLTTEAGRMATETIRDPAAWLDAVATNGTGRAQYESLSRADQAVEYLMMAMRLTEGADLARYARLAGSSVDDARLAPLIEDGLAVRDGDRLAVTARGRPVLNAILRQLLA